MRRLLYGGLLIAFVVVLAALSRLSSTNKRSGTLSIRTDSSQQYDEHGSPRLIVSNTTPHDVSIPTPVCEYLESTFRFYKSTPLGWERLFPFPSWLAVPITDGPELVVLADDQVEIGLAHAMTPYLIDAPTGEFMAQIRYDWAKRPTDRERVQYSNPFLMGEVVAVAEKNVIVGVSDAQSLTFDLQNNSYTTLWFPGACSSALVPYEIGKSQLADDGRLSLQRLTDEGGWQVVRSNRSDCADLDDPIVSISPGQTATVDAAKWFQPDLDALEPGTYRWDVVVYLQPGDILDDNRHVFSEPFEYTP